MIDINNNRTILQGELTHQPSRHANKTGWVLSCYPPLTILITSNGQTA